MVIGGLFRRRYLRVICGEMWSVRDAFQPGVIPTTRAGRGMGVKSRASRHWSRTFGYGPGLERDSPHAKIDRHNPMRCLDKIILSRVSDPVFHLIRRVILLPEPTALLHWLQSLPR